MQKGRYKGNEFPERKGNRIDILPCFQKGEYKIRFEDGKVYRYIFKNEIEFS